MSLNGLKISAGVLVILLFGCASSPEARTARFLSRGKNFVEKKDYNRALLEFRNAAKATPNDAEVYYQMGNVFAALRDGRSAYVAYSKAVSLNPKHLDAQIKLARIQAGSSDPQMLKNTEQRLKDLLQSNAPTADMLTTLAFTELKLGNSQSAIDKLEEALIQAPQELSAAVMLAKAKWSVNDVKGAEMVLQKAAADTPKSADARAILGEFYAGQNRFTEAEAAYRQALMLDPKNGPALMDFGRLELAQGRKPEAEQTFKQLVGIDGYKSTYAVYLYQAGRSDEAVREFERLFKENPDERQMRTNLVIAYRTTNHVPAADKLLESALKKNPKDGDALLQRAEIAIGNGQYAQAETDLNLVMKLRPTAPEVHYIMARLNLAKGMPLLYRQDLSEALRLNPNLLAIRIELAQSLNNDKQPQAALDVVDSAPAHQRSSVALLVQRNWALWGLGNLSEMRKSIDQGLAIAKTVDLLVQDGIWKLRADNPTGARAALEQALNIDPTDMRALYGIQQSYMAQKNAPMAIQKVKELVAQHPKSAAIQEFLGTMLVSVDRAQARAAFEAARAADPNFVRPELSLVQMDVLEGKTDDAEKRLNGLLSKDNGNRTARLWLGNVEEMRNQHDRAIESFQKVVAVDSTNAQAYNNLAYLLIDKRLDDALRYAQTAVELAPTHPAYSDTLGWILYRKGLYRAAIPYLERASSNPTNVVWKYHLAMAYAKAGDVVKGRSTMASALRSNANVPEAKMALEVVGMPKENE